MINGLDSVDGCFSWDRPDVAAVSKEIVKRCKREAKRNKKNANVKAVQISMVRYINIQCEGSKDDCGRNCAHQYQKCINKSACQCEEAVQGNWVRG